MNLQKARMQTRIERGQEGVLSGIGTRVRSVRIGRVRVLCASLVQLRVGRVRLVCSESSRPCSSPVSPVREGERREGQTGVLQSCFSCSAAPNGDSVRQVGTGLFDVHFASGPVRQQLPAERHVPYYSCTNSTIQRIRFCLELEPRWMYTLAQG